MSEKESVFPAYLASLRMLFFAVAGAIVVMIVALILVSNYRPSMANLLNSLSEPLAWPVIAGFVALAVLARSVHRRMAARARAQEDLAARLQAFRAACVMAWAMVEGGIVLLLVHFYMTGAVASLALAIGAFLFFLSAVPTREWVARWLELSDVEKIS